VGENGTSISLATLLTLTVLVLRRVDDERQPRFSTAKQHLAVAERDYSEAYLPDYCVLTNRINGC
jgi:hypothetical protein